MRKSMDALGEQGQTGTNLNLIQEYFSRSRHYEIISFEKWVNCNTVQDYNAGITEIGDYENIE